MKTSNPLAFEYQAYVDGVLIEKTYAGSIGQIRDRLRFLVRKHNKIVVYQIDKLSHFKRGTERRTRETGWLALDGTFRKTSTSWDYERQSLSGPPPKL